MHASRRQFLQAAAAVTVGFKGLHTLLADPVRPVVESPAGDGFGPLTPDPEKFLDLPAGFRYRIISRMGETMEDGLRVPGEPDGMATFAGPDGKIVLICNHELDPPKTEKKGPFGPKNELIERIPADLVYDRGRGRKPMVGGTRTMLYNPLTEKLERQYLSLAGTENNCAGGPTPWGSWISCEETTTRANDTFERDHGFAFEVPATLTGKPVKPVPLTDMGRFRREAIAVDPRSGAIYQTEDILDGCFYRFLPNKPGGVGRPCDFSAGGRLQALCVVDQPSLDTRNWMKDGKPVGSNIAVGARFSVRWVDLDDVLAPKDDLRHRGFAAGAARFARTEGIWLGSDGLYFACTTGGRIERGQIWRYTPSPAEGGVDERKTPATLELFLEPNDKSLINNADNLTVAPWGDLIVCEDPDKDPSRLVGVTPAGKTYVLGKNTREASEFAGVCFSPDGKTLFVNVQQIGYTIAITGPWDSRAKA